MEGRVGHTTTCKVWRCENCDAKLAMVVCGEAHLTGSVVLRPESVGVECPKCGHLNPWHRTNIETIDTAIMA